MPLYGKHFENNLIMFQRKLTSKHEHCLHLAPVAAFPQRGISLRFCRVGCSVSSCRSQSPRNETTMVSLLDENKLYPCWPVNLESNSFKRNWEFYNTDIINLETIPENYSILAFQRKTKFRKSFSKFMLLAIFECFGVVILYFRRHVLHMLFLRKNLSIFLQEQRTKRLSTPINYNIILCKI